MPILSKENCKGTIASHDIIMKYDMDLFDFLAGQFRSHQSRNFLCISPRWEFWIDHPQDQWPFQEPKLEVPTIYVRGYPHKM